MKIGIDFAPNRPVLRRAATFLIAASLPLVLVALLIYRDYAEVQVQHIAMSKDISQTAVQPSITLRPVEVHAVNQAIRQLNLPWNRMFSEVESRLNENIALLSVEPDAAKRLLRIQGEAKSAQAMLDFVGSFACEDFFTGATLGHHEINESDPNKPIRFVMEATWQDD